MNTVLAWILIIVLGGAFLFWVATVARVFLWEAPKAMYRGWKGRSLTEPEFPEHPNYSSRDNTDPTQGWAGF